MRNITQRAMRSTGIAAVLLAAALVPRVSIGCGFHGQLPDLAAAHPRSLGVAFAVRDAFDASVLQPLPPAPPALGLVRATRLLHQFSPLLPSAVGADVGAGAQTVTVLLVESGLWTRYAISADGVRVEPHVDGPRAGEHVLVTSEAALQAMVAGQLDTARAQALGLLVADRAA